MGDPPSKEEDEFFDAFDNMETADADEETHYTILGVSPNAREQEIMSAFRQKSRSCAILTQLPGTEQCKFTHFCYI